VIAWGIVATAQCTIHNEAGFYLTRVLLGIGESGFIPGAIYYMSTMFTAKEMSGMYVKYSIRADIQDRLVLLRKHIRKGLLRTVSCSHTATAGSRRPLRLELAIFD